MLALRFLAIPALTVCLLAQEAPPAGGGGAPAGGGGASTGGGGAPGGGGLPAGGGLGNTGGGRNTPGVPGQPGQQNDPFGRNGNQFPDMGPRPIFLSGKVMMEDGGPPPEPVTIERMCSGNSPRPEGYTDSKGHFSIELGRNQGVFADASTGGSDFGDSFPSAGQQRGSTGMGGMGMPGGGRAITERDLMNCEIRASLPGFRSDVVSLAGRRSLDNPNVGTILLKRLANVEGLTTSGTTLMAPKDAKKAYEKARDLMRKKKPEEARKEYEKALGLYPKYAVAWYELGLVHDAAQRAEDAQAAYAKSVEADPKFIKPYMNIAAAQVRDQKWKETAETTGKAIKLNPYDFPMAYLYNSLANYNLKEMDAAELSAREGMKADKDHRIPKLAHILGVVLAQKQDFAGAAENMKLYLKHAMPGTGDVDVVKKQLEQVEGFLNQKAEKIDPPAQQP